MLGVLLCPEEQGTLLPGLPGEGEHMPPSCSFLLFYLHLLPRQQEPSQEILFSEAICVSATRIFFSLSVITEGVTMLYEQNFAA